MGVIDKGIPQVCLFQSDGIKTFLSNYICVSFKEGKLALKRVFGVIVGPEKSQLVLLDISFCLTHLCRPLP